ncbi:MAG: amidohydrolase family protein [Phycisphaerales bacterium]|nr:amidohydrolase family protein [Phycisphaerales bacterium]
MSLYLRDVTFIDWRTLAMTRGHLEVEEGDGGGVKLVTEIPRYACVFDCGGRLVTKSFAIGHHHIYSALARGMPAPKRTPRSFVEILKLIWWNLDRKLDAAMIRASARVVALEAVLSGCTFIIDHHASPTAPGDSLHIIAEVLEEAGLSHLLCYELSDRDGAASRAAGLAETEAYLRGRQGLVGLHASFTVGDDLLARAVELAGAQGTGVHIHVAEAESDEEACRAAHGCSVAARLQRAGALDLGATLLAHCLHLDDAERAMVAGSRAWVVHCTQSNQNNAVGAFDPRGLGDRILIGTDGMHSDVLAGARAMYLEGQGMGGLSPLDGYRRMRRVHDYLAANGFRGDGENNLVVLDYAAPTPVTSQNWPGHVMYGLSARHVHAVISDGRVIMRDQQVLGIDVPEALADARAQARRLWEML